MNHHPRIDPRVCVFLVALWCLMTLWNFGLPGLYMDEANHFAFIPGILSEEAAKLHHYRLYDNWLDYQDGVLRYPIIGGSFYNTEIRPYIAIPFFSVTGYSVETLRLFSSLIALAALLSATTLANRLFGAVPALLTGLLIILDANNVFSIRAQGGLFWMVVLFASLAGHFLLTAHRRESPSILAAAGAGACIALAVLCYFVGAALALPLVIVGVAVFRKRISHLVVFLVSGAVAYSPVIYSVASAYLKDPATLRSFGVPKFAQKKAAPFASSENLDHVYQVLRGAFGSFDFARHITTFVTPSNWANLRLLAVALGLTLLPALYFFLRRKSAPLSGEHRVVQGVFWTTFAIYMLSLFFVRSINLHHLIPLSMFVALYIASMSGAGFPIVRKWAIGLSVIMLLVGGASTFQAQQALRRVGGSGLHNEVVSMPADFFRTTLKGYHPVFVSWGFHLQYLFLTEGKSPYTFMSRPNADRIRKALADNGKVGIVVSNADRAELLKVVDLDQEIRLTSRDGRPIYSIGLIDGTRAADATPLRQPEAGAAPRSAATPPPAPKLVAGMALQTTPSPLPLCDSDAGTVEVHWDFRELRPSRAQIWVSDGHGKRVLWAAPSKLEGSQKTGPWVRDGTAFDAVDAATGRKLGSVDVAVTGCE